MAVAPDAVEARLGDEAAMADMWGGRGDWACMATRDLCDGEGRVCCAMAATGAAEAAVTEARRPGVWREGLAGQLAGAAASGSSSESAADSSGSSSSWRAGANMDMVPGVGAGREPEGGTGGGHSEARSPRGMTDQLRPSRTSSVSTCSADHRDVTLRARVIQRVRCCAHHGFTHTALRSVSRTMRRSHMALKEVGLRTSSRQMATRRWSAVFSACWHFRLQSDNRHSRSRA
mmetsp:Transcript_29/g.74  ORF Transcript_29/g.74 Transcript_29/m.74 type:complete len:232 (-) Transcript_29:613-1308(-)